MTAAVLGILFCSPAIRAQTPASSSPSDEGWRFQFAPYLWASSFKGRVGVGGRTAEADASFTDIVDQLNFGFMGLLDARRNRFVTVSDLVYIHLSDDKATATPLFSNLKAIGKSMIFAPEAGYRLAGSDASYVDALGGIRFWHVSQELQFEPGAFPGIDLEGSRSWVDGIVGLRGRKNLSDVWHVRGYADVGVGGANLTYQFLGAAGASVGDRGSLVFGYRYLKVNYDRNNALFEIGMQGPIIGFAFAF